MGFRVINAFILTAIAPVAVSLITAVVYVVKIGGFPEAIPVVITTAALVAGVISLLSLSLIGIPLYLIFQRLKISSFKSYLISGVLCSICILLILYGWQWGRAVDRLDYQDLILITVSVLFSGPFSAAVFWYVRRPRE